MADKLLTIKKISVCLFKKQRDNKIELYIEIFLLFAQKLQHDLFMSLLIHLLWMFVLVFLILWDMLIVHLHLIAYFNTKHDI